MNSKTNPFSETYLNLVQKINIYLTPDLEKSLRKSHEVFGIPIVPIHRTGIYLPT